MSTILEIWISRPSEDMQGCHVPIFMLVDINVMNWTKIIRKLVWTLWRSAEWLVTVSARPYLVFLTPLTVILQKSTEQLKNSWTRFYKKCNVIDKVNFLYFNIREFLCFQNWLAIFFLLVSSLFIENTVIITRITVITNNLWYFRKRNLILILTDHSTLFQYARC